MPISEVNLIDCMQFMKGVEDNFFDLAIIDPPYGIDVIKRGTLGSAKVFGKGGKRYKAVPSTDYGSDDWDSEPPDKEYFKELFRISKNQIIWGANHFISKLPIQDASCWIVWDKNNSGAFADCELAWTSFDTAVRKFKYTWNGMLQEKMNDKENRIHPTQKPVDLYKWLLKNYAKPGFKIFDSHLGSQSSRIAAYDAGLDFWGCELKEKYYNEGCARFEAFKLQYKDPVLGRFDFSEQGQLGL